MKYKVTRDDFSFYYHPRDRFWTRAEEDAPYDMCFVVDQDDDSPIWPHWHHGDTWRERYNPACAACWLNITHSRYYHMEAIQ